MITVVIASKGRPGVLHDTVAMLGDQTTAPGRIIISVVEPEDVRDATRALRSVEVILATRGSCAQRNAALDIVGVGTDVVVFLDDDVELEPPYLGNIVRCFERRSDVDLITGNVVLDARRRGGVSREVAQQRVRSLGPATPAAPEIRSGYGCNMAVRWDRAGPYRFDERLALYGWMEDLDYSRALLANGGVAVRLEDARAVHLGVPSGRVSEKRYGYSQVVNPAYLWRKGSLPARSVLFHYWPRALVANLVRAPRPGPVVDARGRLLGNLIGIIDLLRGRLRPERVVDL